MTREQSELAATLIRMELEVDGIESVSEVTTATWAELIRWASEEPATRSGRDINIAEARKVIAEAWRRVQQ